MRSSRVLVVVGFLCLMVGGSSLIIGSQVHLPWLTVAATVIGVNVLVAGLVAKRAETDRPATNDDPARGERHVPVVTSGLVGVGLVTVLVALVVAEGEARGHAIAHLLVGFVCVGLFAALAFSWHPRAGSGAATLRGFVLALLAAAAFSAFMESLGGAGYDSANAGSRIDVLTTLHSIAVPFGALSLVAIPVAVITAVTVLVARATRRGRTVRT